MTCETDGGGKSERSEQRPADTAQAATAALAAAGYRPAREAHHYRVIQSLAYTIEADASLIAQLDKFRKKRNIGSYERAGVVSDQEAKVKGVGNVPQI